MARRAYPISPIRGLPQHVFYSADRLRRARMLQTFTKIGRRPEPIMPHPIGHENQSGGRNGIDYGSASSHPTNASEKWRYLLRFRDDFSLPYVDHAERFLCAVAPDIWGALLHHHPSITVNRLFRSVTIEDMELLNHRVRQVSPNYIPPKFSAFFVLECDKNDSDFVTTARRLSILPHVKTVEQMRNFSERGLVGNPFTSFGNPGSQATKKILAVNLGYPVGPLTASPPPNPLSNIVKQLYLFPEPYGVDALYAWNFPGGNGHGQTLISVEPGWYMQHESLQGLPMEFLSGSPVGSGDELNHGTNSLGVICAPNNDIGVVGIAYDVSNVYGAQWLPGSTAADILLRAIVWLLKKSQNVFGIVLHAPLGGTVPTEWIPGVFEVLQYGTNLGIVVVEAAGNGPYDLDAGDDAYYPFPYFDVDNPWLNANSDKFKDSGAIMVGGSYPAINWSDSAATDLAKAQLLMDGVVEVKYVDKVVAAQWWTEPLTSKSNSGSRIDCFAWNDLVYTCEYGTDKPTKYVYYDGISAASSIIAGVALVVQGFSEAKLGNRLSPLQVRALLRTAALGTPSTLPSKLRSMPDLVKLKTFFDVAQQTSIEAAAIQFGVDLDADQTPVGK